MSHTFFSKYKHTLLYGAALALLLFLLKWLQWRFIIIDLSILGIWVAQKLARPQVKTVVVEKPVYLSDPIEFTPDSGVLKELTLSKREMEVLQLMAEGLSNEEIASRLFVSLSTIKTHNSRLFEKMDVRRRTQAIEKAKRLKIIP